MRRLLLGLTIAGMTLLLAAPASAGIYTLMPTPSGDLWDLDHYKAYSWGINWAAPQSEAITNVVLTYKGIYDWTYEPDLLTTTLLDNPAAGVSQIQDNQGGGDYFAGKGVKIGEWSDPFGDYAHRINLSYDFAALGYLDDFQTYAADGRFGFGIDPDCHYFNSGIELKIYTSSDPVPEPATLTLFGVGVAGLGYFRRRQKST